MALDVVRRGVTVAATVGGLVVSGTLLVLLGLALVGLVVRGRSYPQEETRA